MTDTTIDTSPNAQVVSTIKTETTENGIVQQSQIGISEDLKRFIATSDFKMDWSRRRWVVYTALIVLGTIITIITGVLVALLFMRNGSDFERLLDVVTTLIYADIFAVMTLIGSYVFGAQYDATNYRSSIVEMINISKNNSKI